MRCVIWAYNIHFGGGLVLLKKIINAKSAKGSVFFLDKRIPDFIVPKHVKIIMVKPNLLARILAEIQLKKYLKQKSVLICFGNFPPFFISSEKILLYIQNKYLSHGRNTCNLNFYNKSLFFFKRLFLKIKIQKISKIFVQTESMKQDLKNYYGLNATIFPIEPNILQIKNIKRNKSKEFNFVYVASGEPHKNHLNLIHAWVLLADAKIFPTLALTIDCKKFPKLSQHIIQIIKEKKIKVTNLGHCHDICKVYDSSIALIYPSLIESHGLPLIEAHKLGMPILAGELDFVRDSCDPIQTFDPTSPFSIARAVRRYLFKTIKKPILNSADQFLRAALEM